VERWKILLAGSLVGFFGVLLVKFGNPVNMGVCVACFVRDIAGALGMHRAEMVQYIRPEIAGFILGSFVIALFFKEFRPRGGSAPLIRFVLGFFLMTGALVFLGCPLRMILRLANGDLNALVGLFGFTAGIIAGIQFIKQGFSLGRSYSQTRVSGYLMPAFAIVLLMLLMAKPAFIFFSQKGPGSLHAPVALSLVAGLAIGAVLQRTRLCTAGGIRDAVLLKDFYLLWGLLAVFLVALLGNLLFNFGQFKLGFVGQPVAHSQHLWNFLGMFLAGTAAVMLGGCPLRQTILAGEGDIDAGVTVLGMLVGAAFSHNFGMAASAQGVSANAQIGVLIGIVVVFLIGLGVIAHNLGMHRKERIGIGS